MALEHVFIHHVFFWLKNPSSQSDLDSLLAGLKKLTAVKTIKQWHIGRAAGTHRDVVDRSYSLSWLILFDNLQDQDSYQRDPIHLHFVEECSGLWSRVQVYDCVDAA
jgi:hypothetical protein